MAFREETPIPTSLFAIPVPLDTSPPGRKATTSSAWSQLLFQIYLYLSCLPEAVVALRGCSHYFKGGRQAAALSCFNPAQEGNCLSLWAVWLKYQGYTTANDGHRRGSFSHIQNKSRTPCKQQWGMCSHNMLFPVRASTRQYQSHKASDIFAPIPLNNLHATDYGYSHTRNHKVFIIPFDLKLI